jgi:hypothetical protein
MKYFLGLLLFLFSAFAHAAVLPAKMALEWDFTSFKETDLRVYEICQAPYQPDGQTSAGVNLKVLGIAVVYMAPGYKTSPAGHVGIRFVYCFGQNLNDRLVEITRFGKNEDYGFLQTYPEQSGHDLRRLDGKLFYKMSNNPAAYNASRGDALGYGYYQNITNRNVYESWLNLDGPTSLNIMRAIFDKYQEQGKRLAAMLELEKYDQFSNNCVTVLNKILQDYLTGPGVKKIKGIFTPSKFYKRINKYYGQKMVLYPSQRSLRMYWNALDQVSNGKEKWLSMADVTDSEYNKSLMIYYPYGMASEPNFFESVFAAIVNTPVALVQTIGSVVASPVSHDKKAIGANFTKLVLSMVQLTGWTFLHPAPTPWSQQELERLAIAANANDPIILPYLQSKLSL